MLVERNRWGHGTVAVIVHAEIKMPHGARKMYISYKSAAFVCGDGVHTTPMRSGMIDTLHGQDGMRNPTAPQDVA